MGRGLLFDDETSRWALPAGLLSVAAHLSVLFAVAKSSELLPPAEPLSPLRFVGQTFDVDALGEANQDEARPPASDSAPVVQKPAPPPRPSAKPPEDPPPKAEPKPDLAPPLPATKPVDPFDLAVPGDASSNAAPSAPSETGSFGAEGRPASVTDVFKAFLHIFPEANRHNPAWKELPLGPLGRVEFSLVIGEGARLVSIEIHKQNDGPPPKLLVDAIRKTQPYLLHQRLGWEAERRPGRQRLALTVVVQKKAPHATTPEREGIRRHGRYGETRPGGAFFTFYDGHHIDVELERVSADVPGP